MHDFRTLQDHAAPATTTDLLFKGAVQDRGRSVYSGLIRVRPGARGTNAFQTNRNLVLSEGARADSVPNLEIDENDVGCSHASAVGPVDEEQRFYLESRGVPPEVADRLIVLGFFGEVLDRLPSRPGRRRAGHHRPPAGVRTSRPRPPAEPVMATTDVRLCAVDELAAGTARRFDVGEHRIALVRIGDDFYAIGDRCSHADFSLAEGEVWPDEREIECWKHGSTLLPASPASPSRSRPPCPCPSTRSASSTATCVVGAAIESMTAELVLRITRPAGRHRRPGDPAGHRPDGAPAARSTPSWAPTARASRRCRT